MSNNLGVQEINTLDVFFDNKSNSRESVITLISVAPLIESIRQYGLLAPIIVEKLSPEDAAACGKPYSCRAGFRRGHAHLFGGMPTIKAQVFEGLTPIERDSINLIENLERQQLTFAEEARAIYKLYRAHGLGIETISKRIKRSQSYIDLRIKLLALPKPIFDELDSGAITLAHAKGLLKYATADDQMEAVRRIKERLAAGDKVADSEVKKPATDKKKKRDSAEIVRFIKHCGETIGYGLHTRAAAWAMGNITTDELIADIKEHADERNIPYQPPADFPD